jgi:NitT/TauT family transport system substrate-binding protein
MTIHTHQDVIQENPDLVRRFVKATVRSWEAAKEDPDAAVDAALEAKPDLNRESTLKQLEVDLGLLSSENTEGKGIGYGADEDWERTKQLLVEYRELETGRPGASFYTNEFLPE